MPPTDIARFWRRVNKNGPIVRPELGPCWLWTGSVQSSGYGSISFGGRKHLTHRLAWILEYGKPPEPQALHRCDMRRCVNVGHLFEGTQADNMADAVAKGRVKPSGVRGEQSGNAKLTESSVAELRRLRASGASYSELARLFGISKSLAYQVARRIVWKHVA